MIIDCISDLHGHYPQLEGGDFLIVGGDLTANDTIQGYDKFFDWLSLQSYKKKIFIGGNHDTLLEKKKYSTPKYCDACYLCDSGTEFEYDTFCEGHQITKTLKIWGSPWTKRFKGMNPACMAFTMDTEEELAEKFAMIPDDVDILITHSPPWGYFDHVNTIPKGSESLLNVIQRIRPKLCVFGHIHENGGMQTQLSCWSDRPLVTKMVNASHVNERYEPVNKPVRIIL